MRKIAFLLILMCLLVATTHAQDDDVAADMRDSTMVGINEVVVVFDRLTGELLDPLLPGQHQLNTERYLLTTYPTTRQVLTNDITVRSVDGQEVRIILMLIYQIDPENVNNLHRNFADTYQDEYIIPLSRGILRNVAATVRAEEFLTQAEAMQAEVLTILNDRLQPDGLILHEVLFEDVIFSEGFAAAIEARSEAEARIGIAQREADSVRVEAQARRDAAILEAEGQAQAIIIQAQAQVEMFSIISEIIAQNPLLLEYYALQQLGGNINTLVVPADGFFSLDLETP